MWISVGVAPSTSLLTAAARSRYDDRRRLSTGRRETRAIGSLRPTKGGNRGSTEIAIDDQLTLKPPGRGDERPERHLRWRRRLQLDDARPDRKSTRLNSS